MVTKRDLLVLAGIAIIVFTNCQTGPKVDENTDHVGDVSGVPQWVKEFFETHGEELVGVGTSPNESRRKNRALEDISRQLSYKLRETAVNFYSDAIDQQNVFRISFAGFLPHSTVSSWLEENGIVPKAEYSEGEWYCVAYDIPESVRQLYPHPIMPVVTLFTIEEAVKNAAGNISDRLPGGSKIAVINISASDPEDAEFVMEELSTELVNIARAEGKGYTTVDRRSLDAIRKEQNFQASGDVSDDTIVSIGKFLGADVVITGSITGANEFRRLRIKALDVKTARLLIQTNLKY